MQKFSMVAKLTAKTGEGETLARLLLEAGTSAQAIQACEAYVIHISDSEPDTLWVTEIWTSAEAHAEALTQAETRAAITQAMPYIAGVEGTKLRPLGGKGS
ncbi:putative quinol monooxygenase [Paenibacillus sp. Soil750]|uniref:putative quinol monooxygenase n=1 Tax=Paenibacillus sp. Soil750 TaxID=1736398 RepID=UPI0006F50689|nr:antibiotic biosynthesis monooxygenase [Paenibacillus sp. Soil750]KRE59320.1 antibiotic biosynthesis monooxygenase [Paenibacillus sp. Soil750]